MSHPNAPPQACSADQSAESSNISECSPDNVMEESDDEGGWITKVAKKRRHGSNSSEATIITQPTHNLVVIVKPTNPTTIITNMNPLALKQMLENLAPDGVIQIRPNYRLNLLAIDARNIESTKSLLQLKKLGTIQVQTYEPAPPSSNVGVIRGVSTEITDADLWASIREKAPVIQVRRLGKTEAVKLVFSTRTSPEYVFVGHTRYSVLSYLEKPRQCPKCNRFGHLASTCSKTQRCSRCGGEHVVSECEAKQPRCINCKRGHDATSRNCPAYKAEKQITNYRSSNNVDYTSAKTVITNEQKVRGLEKHRTPHKQKQSLKGDKKAIIPEMNETDFPPLDTLSSEIMPKPMVPSAEQPESSPKNAEAVSTQNTSKNQEVPRKWAREHPAQKKPRSVATPKSQSLGNALCTIVTLLRSFLTSLQSPIAQAMITIIDIVVPLATSWCN